MILHLILTVVLVVQIFEYHEHRALEFYGLSK
jgi:hypothetical protein